MPDATPFSGEIWTRPVDSAVLYDNGQLVNCPGCGVGGADESVLQNVTLGMNSLGFGHQATPSIDNRIADDFTVPAGNTWDIQVITFFAYQTGGGPGASTMTAVNLEVWDGIPAAVGSNLVYDALAGNGMIASTWSGIYRVTEITSGAATDRAIMADLTIPIAGPLVLGPGTYYLAWRTDGTLSSGPWAPPITINGQTTTGNGLQSTDGGASYAPALDSGTGTQQGFPFIIEGIVMANLPPHCDAGGPYAGEVGEVIELDGTGSSDPDGTIISYAWDFGDGSTGTGAQPVHIYTDGGLFAVTLTVTDDDGASSSCETIADIIDWIGLDGTPPGTPADVALDPVQSTAEATVLNLQIHGFWLRERQGPGDVYQEVYVPGLGSITMAQLGAPDLPVLRFDVAVATGANQVVLDYGNVIESQVFPGFNVWPQPIEGLNDTLGTPETFQIAPEIYSLNSFWPPENAVQVAPTELKMGIPAATCVVYPFQWNPTTRRLRVQTQTVYAFRHEGTAQVQPAITKDRNRMASVNFANWPVLEAYFPVNLVFYQGDFLFIYPMAYKDALNPLVTQKRARGFHVETQPIAGPGTTCDQIRNAIGTWYAANPSNRDHYCLLVGDTDAVPLCDSPTNLPTDDLYGSVNGDDLDEEVFVGRLSVDSEADLSSQVAKILAYEDNPPTPAAFFDDALLVAHKEGAPGKYEGAHESVRTATYAVAPTFHTVYGSQPGQSNADVSGKINGGMGVVAYRGHGSATAWAGWNLGNQSYSTSDVQGLTNGDRTSVVWSLSCNNSELSRSDCIAETWLSHTGGGAVAHYGSTERSSTIQNHELDRQLFSAVYDLSLTTHSHAIAHAEHQMAIIEGDRNAWMYLLLGDPEMRIRRENPMVILTVAPDTLSVCEADTCVLRIRVLDQSHFPMPGVLVAAWKPGPDKDGPPEVLDNRYTLEDGWAQVPCSPQSPGWVHYTVRDEVGNALRDSVRVGHPSTSVGDGAPPANLSLTARPTMVATSTRLDLGHVLEKPAQVTIYDVFGRMIRRIEVRAGERSVDWDTRNSSGQRVTSGLYYVRAEKGRDEQTISLVVLR